ncbi:MAG: alanine--tRNA ligase [Actinomycetia bacterium]|nr:alanine--tRNA ligase [Actinomycetes bacterium]MCP4958885.1 alanine--tRNA ligase [Actinomycetes bacterium]
MNSHELRTAFTEFWAERGHQIRPSASLIPHEPSLLFTVAGMVPFMPYFLGEEVPPAPRVTTIQKCVRAGGKHNDLDDIGRTNRHWTFFEMMGNFSFGDYFKPEAIPWAWEFVTEVLGLEADKLWITVHVSDDDAEEIWKTSVGVAADRIQRLDKDNWWAAGDTGPCGPCSEIFYDLGPAHGDDGGPAHGGEERFVEIWNLVFMQYNRDDAGELHDLPATGIDTGAGLERILTVLQGVETGWDIDTFQSLLAEAQRITGVAYGEDTERDVSLRIFCDHARATTFLISDGVFPSNEDRGYVLRRIIRRAIRHAWVLGVETSVMPELVGAVVDVMGEDYPDIVANQGFITDVVRREEERFRRTLATGSEILDRELADLSEGGALDGSVAFQLHDTYGFPVEVTEEILGERGFMLDREGFDIEMDAQRDRARAARAKGGGADTEVYRDLVEQFGPTEFERSGPSTTGRVLSVVDTDDGVEVFLDRTTFYAEGGGQVGDTGIITTDSGIARVTDTNSAVAGLTRHVANIESGSIGAGQTATTDVDWGRRAAIRRNHTGTHILHWALREVLGDHVKQAGSHVDSERLRFDFSHFEALTPDQMARIEDMTNEEILANGSCRHYETSMEHAQAAGAVAFFGDKYGDTVRVLEAGTHSIELCGGTHVGALGDIGHLRIVSESSIGSNLRRVEAITGTATVERLRADEELIGELSQMLAASPEELIDALQRRNDEIKTLQKQLKALQQAAAAKAAGNLTESVVDGVVIARLDGIDRDTMRDMAAAARETDGIDAVILAGAGEKGGVTLVAAVKENGRFSAVDLIDDAAKAIQGGFGRKGNPSLIVAGGKNVDGIDQALESARAAAGV